MVSKIRSVLIKYRKNGPLLHTSDTLTVELLEKKNPDATSTEIAVDAFDVRT